MNSKSALTQRQFNVLSAKQRHAWYLRRNFFLKTLSKTSQNVQYTHSYENNVHEKDSMAATQLIALFPRTHLPLVYLRVVVYTWSTLLSCTVNAAAVASP